MTYSWQNEDGEPIMSGEAWRFEQQLDMDAQADYDADVFYDNEGPDLCHGCGEEEDECTCDDTAGLQNFGGEDSWLDGSYEE